MTIVQNLRECIEYVDTMEPYAVDHASRHPAVGSRMGIEGTRKWPDEGFTRRWPDLIEMDAETRDKVASYWSELGIE